MNGKPWESGAAAKLKTKRWIIREFAKLAQSDAGFCARSSWPTKAFGQKNRYRFYHGKKQFLCQKQAGSGLGGLSAKAVENFVDKPESGV